MAKLIDLTFAVPKTESGHDTVVLEECRIERGRDAFTALVYSFAHGSMAGSYIDFPGHIKKTNDGMHAGNYPIEKLFRVKTTVIHLDRASGSGGVSPEELTAACPTPISGGALVLNALGKRRHDSIVERSVYLEKAAVAWIIETRIHLLVSDIYESNNHPQDVFQDLFGAGISTVCCPINLHKLAKPTARVTVLPLRVPNVTQLPCRIVAELE